MIYLSDEQKRGLVALAVTVLMALFVLALVYAERWASQGD